MRELTIAARFRGPPSAANGGYAAGALARGLGGPVEVTLVRPVPLDRRLTVEEGPEGRRLLAGRTVIARARRTSLELEVPDPPGFDEAAACSKKYAGFDEHAFAGCFTCGPRRAPGDGLRLFAGPAGPESDRVLTGWVPAETVPQTDGAVDPEIVWAALDCPGYFAVANVGEMAVLGRMTCEVHDAPAVGARTIVMGWPLGGEGRKLEAATALFDERGRCLARSRHVWIRLEDPRSPDA